MKTNNKILKKQIEETIKVYTEALKDENINEHFLIENNIQRGICLFCVFKDFNELEAAIEKKIGYSYLTLTPSSFKTKQKRKIKAAHKTRILFLKQLLKEIE